MEATSDSTKRQEEKWSFLTYKFFKFNQIKSESSTRGQQNIDFKCLICPKETIIACSTAATSNLRRHIQRKHFHLLSEYDSLLETNKKTTSTNIENPSKRGKFEQQTKIDGYCGAANSLLGSMVTQEMLNKKVVRFIVKEGLPFRIVQSDAFKDLALAGCPGKTILCYRTLMSRIDSLHEEMLKTVKMEMSDVDHICVTADIWSVATRSFIGMTAHWLASDLSRKSVALACRRLIGHHSFDILAEAIEGILKEFSIQNKTVGCVTDSGSNFIKCFRLFGQSQEDRQSEEDVQNGENEEEEEEEEDEKEGDESTNCYDFAEIVQQEEKEEDHLFRLPPHMKCAAHRLNLIATKDSEQALCDPVFKRISRAAFGKCQALWNKQKRSSLSADLIREHCGNILLVIPIVTRWNSTYNALKRLKEILDRSTNSCDGLMDALGLQRFSSRDVQFIKEYVQVFHHFAQALNIVQGEHNCYLGILLPVLSQLILVLEREANNVQICKPLIEALITGVQKRFSSEFEDEHVILAAVVHPRFKVTWIANSEKRTEAWKLLEKELQNMELFEKSSTTSSSSGAEGDGKVANELDAFFPMGEAKKFSSKDILEQYQSRPVSDVQSLKEFPMIESVFRRYNTLLPSSASVERLFSHGGGIFRKNRFQLKDSSFEKQLLLKLNTQ